jgi:antirestriction protein ArdC
MKGKTAKTDVYKDVTDKIIAALEQGELPWSKPWISAGLPKRCTGEPYRGTNILMLWDVAERMGYTSQRWMTYKQAQERGGQVRKDEHGTAVVHTSKFLKEEEGEMKAIPYLKVYKVFNVEQIDGLPGHWYETPKGEAKPVAELDAFFAATKATIQHGGSVACYIIGEDLIKMPPVESFLETEGYYATLAHEMTHWTRHPSRLNRNLGRKTWGDAGYAMEELVAELGSAFVCAELGLTPEIRTDHAAYIKDWLQVLNNDTHAVFTAASHAQKAVDLLLSYQGEQVAEQMAA